MHSPVAKVAWSAGPRVGWSARWTVDSSVDARAVPRAFGRVARWESKVATSAGLTAASTVHRRALERVDWTVAWWVAGLVDCSAVATAGLSADTTASWRAVQRAVGLAGSSAATGKRREIWVDRQEGGCGGGEKGEEGEGWATAVHM